MLASLLAAALFSLSGAAPDTVLSPLPEPTESGSAAPAASVFAAPSAPEIEITPRVNIFALYSGTHGFGLAGGVRARSGSSTATLDGRLSQHIQSGALTLDTHDAATARVYGRIRGVGATDTRWRYHGIGGTTGGEDQLDLNLASARITAGLGVRPLATRAVTIRPEIGLRFDRLDLPTDEQRLALSNGFDVFSRTAIDQSAGQARMALSAGAMAELDTRDRPDYPSAGALFAAGARRIISADGRTPRQTRYDVRVAGFVPLGQRVVLFARASGSVADSDGGRYIPVYLLPVLDDNRLAGFPVGRFRGNDTALFSVGARLPIIDALGAYGIDAIVTASAGNAYRDVFDEFTPAITTRSNPSDDGTASPLRPVLGLGLALVNIPKGKVALGGSVGLGPEGLTLFALRLSTGLGDDLPTLW